MANPVYTIPPVYERSEVVGTFAETLDWGIKKLGFPEAWRTTKGRKKGLVTVTIDTGAEQGRFDQITKYLDFTGQGSREDPNGHHTFIAGLGYDAHDEEGGAGIAPESEGISFKALGNDGSGQEAWLVAAIMALLEVDAEQLVVICSWGSPQRSPRLKAAIDRVIAERPNTLFIFAAGNSGRRYGVNSPACFDNNAAVAAVDKFLNPAPFSASGPEVNIAAPGVDIVSVNSRANGGGYVQMSGTSFACPIVAYGIVLAIAAGVEIANIKACINLLASTATDLYTPGFDEFTGPGLFNPRQIMAGAKDEPSDDGWTTIRVRNDVLQVVG